MSFNDQCWSWFAEIEKQDFGNLEQGDSPMSLASYLKCEAFEARFNPSHVRALRLAYEAVEALSQIMNERRKEILEIDDES